MVCPMNNAVEKSGKLAGSAKISMSGSYGDITAFAFLCRIADG